VRDYRVIASIQEQILSILVVRIGNRRDLYRKH
jgi:mRNA-degrading endonuclease RelE of RelBE toxin-antitoxin system